MLSSRMPVPAPQDPTERNASTSPCQYKRIDSQTNLLELADSRNPGIHPTQCFANIRNSQACESPKFANSASLPFPQPSEHRSHKYPNAPHPFSLRSTYSFKQSFRAYLRLNLANLVHILCHVIQSAQSSPGELCRLQYHVLFVLVLTIC
jgi:hypothetical protein